jgi:hypothetical protein
MKKSRNSQLAKSSNKFNKLLKGKKIKCARYLTRQEMIGFYWDRCPLAIFFEDGSFIIPQTDDEGNDGGAMYYGDNKKKDEIIYTM